MRLKNYGFVIVKQHTILSMSNPISLKDFGGAFGRSGRLEYNGREVISLHITTPYSKTEKYLSGQCPGNMCSTCGIKNHFTLSPLTSNPEDIRYQILEICGQIKMFDDVYYYRLEEEKIKMKQSIKAIEALTNKLGFRNK